MIFLTFVKIKNWLFDCGLIKPKRPAVPVVSIGNLTIGGTGKSPITLSLVQRATGLGLRSGIVSRGYGRKNSDILQVKDWEAPDAVALYGDEPVMIKKYLPKVPFYVGADRFQAATELINANEVDVIFADDAFQHRKLHRSLDIVLIDAMALKSSYKGLPLGRAREPLKSLRRANFVFLTKYNLADQDSRIFNEEMIRQNAPDSILVKVDYHIKNFRALSPGQSDLAPGSKVFAFCGLARPESFFKTCQASLHLSGTFAFPDHHKYSQKDIQDIYRQAKNLGADFVVTTAKDAVKVGNILGQNQRLWVAELEVSFDENIKKLDHELINLAH